MSMRGYANSRGRGGGRGGKTAPIYQEPQVSYGFPQIDVAGILEDMALFDHPLTEAVLKAPKPEDVRDVFTFFLKEIFAEVLDSKLKTEPECIKALSYPEIHEESPGIYHFVRAVYEMCCLAQYSDFNVHDLITPTRQRFRWQLSALLNLAKFRQSRIPLYASLAGGEDDCVAQRDELQAKIENFNAQVADIEAKRAAEELEVEQHKKVIPDLTSQMTEKRKEHHDLAKATSEQKAVYTSLTDKLVSLKDRNTSLQAEISEKRAKVVSSPDRALAEIADMEEKLRKMRKGVEEKARKKSEKQARARAVRVAAESLKIALKAQGECIARLERKKEVENQLRKSIARKDEMEEAMRRDDENWSLLQKSMESMQGRRFRQAQQRDELHKQMEKDTESMVQKTLEAERHSEEVERKVEAYMKRENELKAQTISASKQFADEMTKMAAKHESMREHSENHSRQLQQIMALFAAENAKSIEQLKEIKVPA